MACREGTLEAGRGGQSRRREAKGGAYEEIAKLKWDKGKDLAAHQPQLTP